MSLVMESDIGTFTPTGIQFTGKTFILMILYVSNNNHNLSSETK